MRGPPTRIPDVERLGQLGRATEALVNSLDRSVGGAFRTPTSVFFADRAASGWTVRLDVDSRGRAVRAGVVDLIVRSRRRGLPFAPALRAQRARLGVWAFGGLLVSIGALARILPTGDPYPLPPYTDFFETRPVFGGLVLAAAFVLGWLVTRRHLVAAAPPSADERLAGFVVALGLLGLVAVGLAIFRPYALVFVLPSLYAWLWLPLEGRLVVRTALLVAGLGGPLLGLFVLGQELGLSLARRRALRRGALHRRLPPPRRRPARARVGGRCYADRGARARPLRPVCGRSRGAARRPGAAIARAHPVEA